MQKAGWTLIALFALFMLGGSIAPKLVNAQVALDTLEQLGWPTEYLLPIGLLELLCTLLIIFPRTALPGALLFMGVLGGALASHLRVGSPLFSHMLFSVYLGVLLWAGLWLRDPRIRAVLPLLPR